MIGKSRRMQAKLIGAGFQFLNFLCVDFSLLATTHSSGLGTPEAASTVKRTKAKCESSRSFAAFAKEGGGGEALVFASRN